MNKKTCAIIAAAGSSSRMGKDKLSIDLGGETVLERSIKAMQNNQLIDYIVVVTTAEKIEDIKKSCSKNGISKLVSVAKGAHNRFSSVQKAIENVPQDADYICIHDAARPYVSDRLITEVIKSAFIHKAAAPCLDVVDTIKVIGEDGFITETPNRNRLKTVATPQVFLKQLYVEASKGESDAFDDCELLERKGLKIFPVKGETSNIKITNPGDVENMNKNNSNNSLRIGHGYDVHRLVEGRKFILGGVEIPYEKGLLGHSDADVLVHAVMDAIVGALAIGDIGKLFPDNDQSYSGISSILLLSKVMEQVKQKGYGVVNVDATVICQAPKLRNYIDTMRQNIANCMEIDLSAVNVKATTEEHLGFTGTGEGVCSHAVVLMQK